MIARYPEGMPQPRPRGRPRVHEPRATVSTWVPATLHDRLVKMAEQHTDGNVSALVRRLLILRIDR